LYPATTNTGRSGASGKEINLFYPALPIVFSEKKGQKKTGYTKSDQFAKMAVKIFQFD